MFERLELKHFRSHTEARFDFTPELNLLIGSNGSGKTNLLEALFVLATGKTFRGRDQALIEIGYPWAYLQSTFDAISRGFKCQQTGDILNKEFAIDGKQYKRFPTKQAIAVCLFEPSHLQALYGGPDVRRHLIDQLLCQLSLEYTKHLTGYKRALLQRNNLLRSDRVIQSDELFIWDIRLSEFGQKLVEARCKLIDRFNDSISKRYSDIAGNRHNVNLVHKTGDKPDKYGSWLLAKLKQTTQRDRIVGYTTNGPHRDDILFYLDGELASQTASRGEIRSLMLAYKLLELVFLEEDKNIKPIIMFDDVFSELDETRQQKLLATINGYQAFLTTTHRPQKKLGSVIEL